jgi:hypothetical protein
MDKYPIFKGAEVHLVDLIAGHKAAIKHLEEKLAKVQQDDGMWHLYSPDGKCWTGTSAMFAALAAHRSSGDPILAAQRIMEAIDEQDREVWIEQHIKEKP